MNWWLPEIIQESYSRQSCSMQKIQIWLCPDSRLPCEYDEFDDYADDDYGEILIWVGPGSHMGGALHQLRRHQFPNQPTLQISHFHLILDFVESCGVFLQLYSGFFYFFQLYLFYLFNLGKGPRPSYLAADIFMCPDKFCQM